MNETKDKVKKEIEIKIKMPFLISAIMIVIAIIAVVKINGANSNYKVDTIASTQDAIEEEKQETETEISETEQESKTMTYTAPNGEQYEIIAKLNIPSLGIEYPVLSSTSDELLKVALNKYWGANPHEVGNMVILGHNYENTQFFSKLPNIKIGDIVKITDMEGKTLDYKVYETDIIDPDDNSCTSQLTNGHTEITLITCCNKGTQRFIAKARAN